MRVLVAEDERVSRVALTHVLSRLGYEVIIAEDGDIAWEIITGVNPPSLLLLDWDIPGITGIEICKRLIENPNHTSFFYKILLTAKTGSSSIAQGLESGADDYIPKPFNTHELAARLSVGKRMLEMWQKMRDQMKQLAHADRMVSMGIMAAGVAHEINNPTTFISGNLQLLEQYWNKIATELDKVPESNRDRQVDILKEEMPEIIHDMFSGSSRITEIVNGLKTFSRNDEKKREKLSIHHPISEAIKFSKNRSQHQVSITEEYGENVSHVEINRVEIEQVFVNLFINAIDAIENHTRHGKIHISTKEKDGKVIIEVCDNGPGIPSDIARELFTPFFTTKEVGKGTGLGLSISQNLIVEHGGEISVQNREEGGALFRITLPTIAK